MTHQHHAGSGDSKSKLNVEVDEEFGGVKWHQAPGNLAHNPLNASLPSRSYFTDQIG